MKNYNIAEGFVVGSPKDPYFTIQREFVQNSKLREYLNKKFPTKVNKDRNEYTMIEILKLIETIVEDEILYDVNNPYIIICDDNLATAMNVHKTFITDTYEYIEKQLIPRKDQYQCRGYEGMTNSQHLAKLPTPRWASKEATGVKALKKDITQTYPNSVFKPSKQLEKFLIEQCHRETSDTYNIFEVIAEITNYLSINEDALIQESNPRIMTIKNTPLETALEVGTFDMLQIIHLVRYQLEEIDIPVYIARTPTKTTINADKKNNDENETRGNTFLKHLNKRQSK